MTQQPRSTRSREAGQAIVLIAFIFIGLLAAVGLVVDLGRFLVAQTQLRRAVDAAALAGSAQFRLSAQNPDEGFVYQNINKAARDTLRAHNVPTMTLDTATIDTCYTKPLGLPDTMCTDPPTKQVRVQAYQELPLIFLSLIGWRSVGLGAEATTEAASVDVALVIDISDSMASDTIAPWTADGRCTPGGYYNCVWQCDTVANPYNTDCHPFQEVKAAAYDFLNYLSPRYDRVTVITFGLYGGYCIHDGDGDVNGDGWYDCLASAYDPANGKNGTRYVPLTLDLLAAQKFITDLDIAIPPWAGNPPAAPDSPCPSYKPEFGWDPRQCTNTNVGAGVRAAGLELLKEFDPDYVVVDPRAGPNHPSKERLRVIVLLTDGAANASGLGGGLEENADYGPPSGGVNIGFCPRSTWYPAAPPPTNPFCRAAYPGLTFDKGRHISTSVEYDAVDYALDWADFAMLNEAGGGNAIAAFTIGLGDQVINNSRGDPSIGERLLRYMAAGGDDGDLFTDPCRDNGNAKGNPLPPGTSCGNYYFAPTGGELLRIFQAIAGRIFTRINQ